MDSLNECHFVFLDAELCILQIYEIYYQLWFIYLSLSNVNC